MKKPLLYLGVLIMTAGVGSGAIARSMMPSLGLSSREELLGAEFGAGAVQLLSIVTGVVLIVIHFVRARRGGRSDFSEEDERPAAPGIPLWLWLVGGVGVLLAVAAGAALAVIQHWHPAGAQSPVAVQPPNRPAAGGPVIQPPPAAPQPPGQELLRNGFAYAYRVQGDDWILTLTNRKGDFGQGQFTILWQPAGGAPRTATHSLPSWPAGESREAHHPAIRRAHGRRSSSSDSRKAPPPTPARCRSPTRRRGRFPEVLRDRASS